MLDQQKMFKQMVDFQKTAFDNSFNAMSKFQEQAESVMETFVQQAAWLPDDGKQVLGDWVKAYKQGRDELQKLMESNYAKVEEFWQSFEKKDA